MRSWVDSWQTNETRDRIGRGVAGIIAGALAVLSITAFQSDTRLVCTQVERTIDGDECVGDTLRVPGRDIEMGLTWALFSGVAALATFAPYGARTPRELDKYRQELAQRGIVGYDADNLVAHWEKSGAKYWVSEREGQAFAEELESNGVDTERALELLREYLLTGNRPNIF
jgi:hypothetical protein